MVERKGAHHLMRTKFLFSWCDPENLSTRTERQYLEGSEHNLRSIFVCSLSAADSSHKHIYIQFARIH